MSFSRGSMLLLALVAFGANAITVRQSSSTASNANPIRRVVNMLDMMRQKVKEEGEKEEELYEKFMCYCKTGTGDLKAEIDAAETKIPQVSAQLKGSQELLKQLKEELAQHEVDKKDATDAMDSATAQRKKESSAYKKLSSDYTANILAMGKAVVAIEKGMGGSFLQSSNAQVLRRLSIDMDMNPMDRDLISAFLSSSTSSGYAPQAGQIVGILKQMKDTMEKDLSDAIAAEESGIRDYGVMMSAKTKELKATQEALESKTERAGETEVAITNLAEDLDDTQKSLAGDKGFLAELESSCSTKTAEWEERSKTRSDELIALADTIKILNDDDALEMFKKTLPAPSLIQVTSNGREVKKQALKALKQGVHGDHRLELVALAIRGGGTFDKVMGMVDKMVTLLGKEQVDDDEKKAYCEKSLDKAEDDMKILDQKLADLSKAIDETKELLATLTQEIADLTQGIKELDADVKSATATRKEENAFYKKTMAENTAAMDILKMAANRLAKFYTPKLYKEPAKKELSAAGRVEASFSFVQVSKKDAPPPPPETWGAYETKGEENGGVTQMMQLLMTDLEKEMTEMTTDEKEAQREYETFMSDAAAKRANDSKSIKDKEGVKADEEAHLEQLTLEKKDTTKSAYDQTNLIGDLHGECDWLLTNYGARKAARTGEVESLKKVKAVLSGADFS